jgi:hypothetical protein
LPPHLFQQISAAHKVGSSLQPGPPGFSLYLFFDFGKKPHEVLNGAIVLPRSEMFLTGRECIRRALQLARDADMASTGVTFSATRASDGRHRHSTETHTVGAQQHQPDNVTAGFDTAIRPQLHTIAETGAYEGSMRFPQPDLSR